MNGFWARAVPNLVVFLSGLAIMLLELVAARLVAKHIGSSLETWTTVIGVILAGMSLGNYWGGRLSDLRDPVKTLPTLLAASALLCASTLWTNDLIGGAVWMAGLPKLVRIVVTIALVFFPPACLLGTITPTAARWAIERSVHTGRAIGNISAWATAGSILGTFLTGFVLLIAFGVRSIVLSAVGLLAGSSAVLFLLRGAFGPSAARGDPATQRVGSSSVAADSGSIWVRAVPNAFVFTSGLSIMVVELVGSRMLAREVGASIYTWTALIGVVLAGVTVGNFIGGLLADRFRPSNTLPHLFLVSSILTAALLYTNHWLDSPDPGDLFYGVSLVWRIFLAVTLVFFAPACALGTISPVTAKLALERARLAGTAIGNVYAWGAIGSIVGTFLTGFVLVSMLGTQAVVCAVAGLLALFGVCMVTSGLGHAVWAGVLMAVALAALSRESWTVFSKMGHWLHVRPKVEEGEYRRESNYYTIKVYPPRPDGSRTLVLDNLIHGYVVKDDPRRLKYDYETIYASIMERAGAIPAPENRSGESGNATNTEPLNTLFIGGGSYTYPRFVEACYPGSRMLVAEIDPAVTRTAHEALYLPDDTPVVTIHGDARATIDQLLRDVEGNRVPKEKYQFDFIFGDAFNDFSVPWHLTTREFNDKIKKLLAPDGVYMINIIDNYVYSQFLGSYVQTARKTFEGVEVFCVGRDGELSSQRETWVIAMSHHPIDFTELGTLPGERVFEGLWLTDQQVEDAIRKWRLRDPFYKRRHLTKEQEANAVAEGTDEWQADDERLTKRVDEIAQENEQLTKTGREELTAAQSELREHEANKTKQPKAKGAAKAMEEWQAEYERLKKRVEQITEQNELLTKNGRDELNTARRNLWKHKLTKYQQIETYVRRYATGPGVLGQDQLAKIEAAVISAPDLILTDDYAPVENLLEPVARER